MSRQITFFLSRGYHGSRHALHDYPWKFASALILWIILWGDSGYSQSMRDDNILPPNPYEQTVNMRLLPLCIEQPRRKAQYTFFWQGCIFLHTNWILFTYEKSLMWKSKMVVNGFWWCWKAMNVICLTTAKSSTFMKIRPASSPVLISPQVQMRKQLGPKSPAMLFWNAFRFLFRRTRVFIYGYIMEERMFVVAKNTGL